MWDRIVTEVGVFAILYTVKMFSTIKILHVMYLLLTRYFRLNITEHKVKKNFAF